MKKSTRSNKVKFISFWLIIGTLILFFIENHAYFDLTSWGQKISNTYGYLGLFFVEVLFTGSVLIPLAADPLVFIAGGIMNPFVVGIITGVAAAIGECVAYFVGKEGKYVLNNKRKKWLKKAHIWFKKHGFIMLPIFAFTPLPCDVIGIVCGMINYDLKRFFLGMLIGKIPRTLLLSYAGYYGLNVVLKLF